MREIPMSKTQKTRLVGLRRRASIFYDADNQQHRSELFKLAKACFGDDFVGDEEGDLKSQKWKDIGFQGVDPGTDFRGAGLLGLQNILYFVNTEVDAFRRMCEHDKSVSIEYSMPFALCGVNLSATLVKLLQFNQPLQYTLADEERQHYAAFLTLLEHDEYALEEIFCGLFLYFEDLWTSTHAKYMEFNTVLERACCHLRRTLERHPLNTRDFHRMMCEPAVD